MNERQIDSGCPCGSGFPLAACCAPFIRGLGVAPTALALMRSRYTAYVLGNTQYLLKTWHESTRPSHIALDGERRWLGLDIKKCEAGEAADTVGTVEFVARYKVAGRAHRLHETSRFSFEHGCWYYVGAISD